MQALRNWAKGTAALAVAALAVASFSQDYPSLRGNNQGQGRNSNPSLYGPGMGNLRWFHPNSNDLKGGRIVLNNAAEGSTPAAWVPPTGVSRTGSWTDPNIADEAPFAYQTQFLPGYSFANTVGTTSAEDPTQGATSVFQWVLDPASVDIGPFNIARNYELYVWLPIGPTMVGSFPLYPQRYYVYEVTFGTGERWVEVVDTFAGGQGWVRLGNGGLQTNRLFAYNGTDPITIRLFNTVPLNTSGGYSDAVGTTLVYADAVMAIPQSGTYTASPVVGTIDAPGGGTETRVVAARNEYSLGERDGETVTQIRGTVTSYSHDHAGTFNTWVKWTFQPLLESEDTVQLDNNAVGVTSSLPWAPESLANGFFGTNYLAAPIVADAGTATTVRYQPDLEDGEFEVYLWLPGDANGEEFGQAVSVRVREGATNYDFTVDQSLNRGWVRVGSRRFQHTAADPVEVWIYNHSTSASDVGKKAYADAVRFVGAANLGINSTPVQTKAQVRLPGGSVEERDVVIVAAENGRIYCLDAYGNGDGTTNIYWTYPSTPDPDDTAWSDPNHVTGLDGVDGIATMPNGFNVSSALVQRIDGQDYLFIASTNGRIYCIDMLGRGDMDFDRRRPGTTTRIWSYPNDYPAAAQTSALGAFTGSLVYENTAQGPTIFAATEQGRLYALDARGTASRTTTTRWTYPAMNQPTLGAIRMTPLVEFGNVYFGTDRFLSALDTDGVPKGRFYALNMNTGALQWTFAGLPGRITDDWGYSGPTSATSVLLNEGGMADTVFALNSNRVLYAMSAQGTGGAPTVYWSTDELDSPALGSLTFSKMDVFDNSGTGSRHLGAPVVLVPTSDGRFVALFARTSMLNRFGTRRAWEYISASDVVESSMAQGNSWLYGADFAGNLYAWNNDIGLVPDLEGEEVPGEESVVENDPIGDDFRDAKIKFVTRDAYNQLRQATADYTLATDAANQVPSGVFEWGQTLYILVYDFPYRTLDVNNNPVPPPAVNFSFSVDGRSNRNLTVESRQFATSAPSEREGYAILSFTIQGGGVHALPPGDGTVSFSISTSSVSQNGNRQNIVMSQNDARIPFQVANPIALVMRRNPDNSVDPDRSIGATTNAADPGNLVNGSPNLDGTPANEGLLTATVGVAFHGQSGNSQFEVIDRSLMTLLRGPGRGLDNVRVARAGLEWANGRLAVVKPVGGAYPLFEDYPDNFPNTSLDYPNITASQVKVTKDLQGRAENPVYGPVTLNPPTGVDASNPTTRLLTPTIFDVEISVPKYQPANASVGPDSAGAQVPYGYRGGLVVFVDTNGNGDLERGGRGREAFRELWTSANVAVDEKFRVGTPTVDLGSLSQGSGYTPIGPFESSSEFNPWSGPLVAMFKEFTVFNEGNVNLLDLRLAKATNVGNAYEPWRVFAPGNDPAAWIDSRFDVFSDLDDRFAPVKRVLLQKPRVGDGGPTSLSVNPIRRANPLIGAVQGPLFPESQFRVGPPVVSASIPVGFPIGSYEQTMRVIEDTNQDSSLDLNGGGEATEAYSDPGFTLKFGVRETRITSGFSQFGGAMVDSGSGNAPFRFANDQPSGARDSFGNLVMAFSSTRPAWDAAPPAGYQPEDAWRVYVGTIGGVAPASVPYLSPLRDFNFFTPAAKTRWFRYAIGPLPAVPAQTLFEGVGQTLVAGTARFGAAALPSNGFWNPGLTMRNDAFLAYIGSAQVETANGRIGKTLLLANRIRTAALGAAELHWNSGTANVPAVAELDPSYVYGRPSVVQIGNIGLVMVTQRGAAGSALLVLPLIDDGSTAAHFGDPMVVGLGDAFEAIGSASMVARTSAAGEVFEVAFDAKVRGASHSGVYFARFQISNGQAVLSSLEARTRERVATMSDGRYQASGLLWTTAPVELGVVSAAGNYSNLERPGTRQTDSQTGTISFDTILGGKAFLDPVRGTIRFSGTGLPTTATLVLSYTPRLVRTNSDTSANYNGPSMIYDPRLVADLDYWARPSGAPAQPGDAIRADRYWLSYTRSGASATEATRSYLRSMRYGVQLPTPILTRPDGSVAALTVSGNTGFFQVDPVRGRVYFTSQDEARTVTIAYTGVNAAGEAVNVGSAAYPVVLRTERDEAPVPIDEAYNESQMHLALDAFDPAAIADRRPGVIWMFWRSNRFGVSDLFFQTIAPKLSPTPAGRS